MRLTLTHLTFLGATRPTATVTFGPSVTVIRGPSDTGKSYIVDAIDYMLGAKGLKQIPEQDGYSTILLGLVLPDGSPCTLRRSINGGTIGLYRNDLREGPLPPAPEALTQQHSSTSEGSLSRFLLREVGLDRRWVRKNLRNATDSLSFRNIAHLCVVDETQMQSDIPPVFTGSYVTRTKEVSVLKLLLQDDDDSDLTEVQSQPDRRKIHAAKQEVVDRLINEVEAQLADASEPQALRDQLANIAATIAKVSRDLSGLVDQRGDVAIAVTKAQNSINDAVNERGDLVALRARFGLLESQYASDLQRLAMVREAGDLLHYFRRGTCPFCGAEPENQHLNTACEGDSTAFAEAVEAQIQTTHGLSQDLADTIEAVIARTATVDDELQKARSMLDVQRATLSELDTALDEQNRDLSELILRRSNVERLLGLHDQIASLDKMKLVVADEAVAETAAVAAGIALRAQREFSAAISTRLTAWGYPAAQYVHYDASAQDIVAGDQLRAAHGKGVRAILHAAFSLGLSQYCLDRELPHPGFVVLDSPLVTYRPPDTAAQGAPELLLDNELDGVTSANVAAEFYSDVQRNCDCQVIILENTDPPEPLAAETVDIVFTKNLSVGRYGFFPGPQLDTP